MTAIDLTSEYSRADVDFARPETIPWFDPCLACDLRRQFTPDQNDFVFAGVWNQDVKNHFLDQHKIELEQHPYSDQLGVAVSVKGPHFQHQLAVRFRVIADDSPLKGKVNFDRIAGGRDQAEAHAKIFRDRPDQFADVAVVSRIVRIDDWLEES